MSVREMDSEQIWGLPEERHVGEILGFPLISNNNNAICLKYVRGGR